MGEKSELVESNLKELFQQFKFHLIYKNKKGNPKQGINTEYKQLLAEVKQTNRVRRGRIRNLREVANQPQSRTELLSRPCTSLQTRVWKPRQLQGNQLEGIKENIIVVEQQRDGLSEQIGNLQVSLASLKKNVASMRKEVLIQTAKVQKYKNISYLANSIQRNTESVKIMNSRSYKQLLRQQDEAMSSLKQFKSQLRKDNQDLQNKLVKQQPIQTPKTILKEQPMLASTGPKIDRKFMASLEELIQLLSLKEQHFQEIKAEQTTKIRLKKIQKKYLRQDRIKLHDMLQKFQQKYDVKIESLANLIIYVHQRLSRECQQMQDKCIKMNQIKQLLTEDLSHLNQKQGIKEEDEIVLPGEQKDEEQTKQKRIFKNSQMLLKVVILFHNLIGKFRYLFTMAITLSKEKKNFHDLVVQIGNVYNPNHVLLDGSYEETTSVVTNLSEMLAMMGGECHEGKKQLLNFIFSDLRYALIFRTSWLEQDLNDKVSEESLLYKIQAIQGKCQDIYDSKLKIFSLLVINCLKALSMNKYEKKMVISSKAKDTIFMSRPKTVKIVSLQQQDRNIQTEKEFKLSQTKFHSEQSNFEVEKLQLGEDPRRVVQMLQRLKNQQKMNFKPLQFDSEQVYLYDRKVVIPKYIYQ